MNELLILLVGVAGFEPTTPTPPVLHAATGDALRTSGKPFKANGLQMLKHARNQQVKQCLRTSSVLLLVPDLTATPPFLPDPYTVEDPPACKTQNQ